MNFKSLLVWLTGDKSDFVVMQSAMAVAEKINAHVEALHVTPPLETLSPMMGEFDAGGATQHYFKKAEKVASDKLNDAKSVFENGHYSEKVKQLIEVPIERLWTHVSGFDGPELSARGRLSDLIIMARPEKENGGIDAATIEAALFETARPVMIVGKNSPRMNDLKITIAWDGSREATLSIGFAVPILQLAKQVTIICIQNQKSNDDMASLKLVNSLSQYLDRHSIAVETTIRSSSKDDISQTLLDEVHKNKSDLVIMGAYGHSQLSEYLFGGVSRSLLSDPDISVFMAH